MWIWNHFLVISVVGIVCAAAASALCLLCCACLSFFCHRNKKNRVCDFRFSFCSVYFFLFCVNHKPIMNINNMVCFFCVCDESTNEISDCQKKNLDFFQAKKNWIFNFFPMKFHFFCCCCLYFNVFLFVVSVFFDFDEFFFS